jgi:hypothetical protein
VTCGDGNQPHGIMVTFPVGDRGAGLALIDVDHGDLALWVPITYATRRYS